MAAVVYPFSNGQLMYSLSTNQSESGPATMNILGYACQANMTPPKMAISLYNGTLSKDNFKANGAGVLQVLGEQHAELVTLLGTKSGKDVNKLEELKKLKFEVVERYGVQTIKDLVGVVELKVLPDVPEMELGDHGLFVCEITNYEILDKAMKPLFRQKINELGILL